MAGAMEGTAILPGNTYIPSGLQKLVKSFLMGMAPLAAVQKQHIGSLRLCNFYFRKMFPDKIAGKADIS